MQNAQGLKEFSRFTKETFSVREIYAMKENMRSIGIGDRVMAENLGLGVSHALRAHYGKRILFVCGRGGKGAIGLSAALHTIDKADVSIAFCRSTDEIRNEATAFNYHMLNAIAQVQDVDENGIVKLERMLKSSDVVVEALLGIGMKGRLSRFMVEIIKAVNSSRKRVISIEVPAGVDADTGMPNVASIKADEVFCIYKSKTLCCKRPCCKPTFIDAGIPAALSLLAGPGDVMLATEPRSVRSNKYDTGAVLVIGGSAEYHGAPILTAFSVLRSGTGYVTIAAPRSAAIKMKEESPNLAVRMLPDEILTKNDIAVINGIRRNCAVVGLGMSPSKESLEAILEFMRHCDTPMVVDAAAIRAAALDKSVLRENMILTPHEGEFEALTGIKLDYSPLHERIRAAVRFAKSCNNCTVVLKGHETVVTNGKLLKVNMAESPALSTMGTGDVLAGLIAGYLSRHKDVFECAVAAVHAHAKAGDLLFRQKGIHITAMDVVDALPEVLRLFDVITRQ
jgi:NAD(P)H-hydrate epimerase